MLITKQQKHAYDYATAVVCFDDELSGILSHSFIFIPDDPLLMIRIFFCRFRCFGRAENSEHVSLRGFTNGETAIGCRMPFSAGGLVGTGSIRTLTLRNEGLLTSRPWRTNRLADISDVIDCPVSINRQSNTALPILYVYRVTER